MPEKQNIEYKQTWHDDYLKWVCGFANAIGGTIFIGKDDNGNTTHLQDYKRLLEEIPNKIRNAMGIICDLELIDDNAAKCIAIRVNPYSVPVSLRGRYYYRAGTTKMELTGMELTEFLLRKSGKTWDSMVEERATLADIDKLSLSKFTDAATQRGRMPLGAKLTTFQLLEKLRLTEGKKLRRAAIVLFGKNPGRFFPNLQIKIGRFGADSSDLRFQELLEGNLVELLQEVEVQLNYKFLVRSIDYDGFSRIETDEFPQIAIREMILNALVHRTYMGAPIQLRVFDSKISIWNEGGLPIGLQLNELFDAHNSRPRNPLIADACFRAGYIEAWGTGMLKIMNACTNAKMPPPLIAEKDGGLELTLFKTHTKDTANSSTHEQTDLETNGQTSGQTSGQTNGQTPRKPLITLGVNGSQTNGQTNGQTDGQTSSQTNGQTDSLPLQHQILELIAQNNRISRKELAEKLALAQSTVQKHIAALVLQNRLVRKGTFRGYWIVIKQ